MTSYLIIWAAKLKARWVPVVMMHIYIYCMLPARARPNVYLRRLAAEWNQGWTQMVMVICCIFPNYRDFNLPAKDSPDDEYISTSFKLHVRCTCSVPVKYIIHKLSNIWEDLGFPFSSDVTSPSIISCIGIPELQGARAREHSLFYYYLQRKNA